MRVSRDALPPAATKSPPLGLSPIPQTFRHHDVATINYVIGLQARITATGAGAETTDSVMSRGQHEEGASDAIPSRAGGVIRWAVFQERHASTYHSVAGELERVTCAAPISILVVFSDAERGIKHARSARYTNGRHAQN